MLGACSTTPQPPANPTSDAAVIDGPVDAPIGGPVYRIMAQPELGAISSVRNRVVVIGTQEDGSPADDDVVLGFDRPGAGTYTSPLVTLGNLGATSFFQPCDLATPGCLGPLQLTAALATDPAMVVASVDVEVVDPLEVNPAKRCLIGGNVLHLKGNDSIFTGETTITDATWRFDRAFPEYLVVDVTPTGASGSWSLTFDSRMFAPQLFVEAYENAQRSFAVTSIMELDRPSMEVKGFGNECATLTGRFDVVEYATNSGEPQIITIAFEQHCEGSTTTVLSGCLHFQP